MKAGREHLVPLPAAVLRYRGLCRTVGVPLQGLSRPTISQ